MDIDTSEATRLQGAGELAAWLTAALPQGRVEVTRGGQVVLDNRPATQEHDTVAATLAQWLCQSYPEHRVMQVARINTDPLDPQPYRVADLAVLRHGGSSAGYSLAAAEIELVVEVVTPHTWQVDMVDKLADYGHAGIPHYWTVNIEYPVPPEYQVRVIQRRANNGPLRATRFALPLTSVLAGSARSWLLTEPAL